jgi:hypothetical protein
MNDRGGYDLVVNHDQKFAKDILIRQFFKSVGIIFGEKDCKSIYLNQ